MLKLLAQSGICKQSERRSADACMKTDICDRNVIGLFFIDSDYRFLAVR